MSEKKGMSQGKSQQKRKKKKKKEKDKKAVNTLLGYCEGFENLFKHTSLEVIVYLNF